MRRLFRSLVSIVLPTLLATTSARAQPFIEDIWPPRGMASDDVRIKGGNFTFPNFSSNQVKFAGGAAATVISGTAKELHVIVPDGAASGRITVTNVDGTALSPKLFEVVTSKQIIPSSGSLPGKGDRKQFLTYFGGFKTMKADGKVYYAPPKAIMYVNDGIDDKGNVTVNFPECSWWQLRCVELRGNEEPAISGVGDFKGEYEVKKQVQYQIPATDLQKAPALSQGFDYGLLVLPFKYHFSDQSLTGEATLGGYAGYQFGWPGLALTVPVLSAGVGVVNITKQNGATTTSSSAPSLTLAYGVIINLMRSGLFQIGIISGFDWAGKGSQYKYEGEPWISVSFGTNFTK